MDKKLQTLNRKNTEVLLMGDINIDLSTNTKLASDYVRLLHSNAFCNLITKPTRVTSTTQTIIDHILTNDNESILTPSVLSCKISDHYPIYCAIKNINNNKAVARIFAPPEKIAILSIKPTKLYFDTIFFC